MKGIAKILFMGALLFACSVDASPPVENTEYRIAKEAVASFDAVVISKAESKGEVFLTETPVFSLTAAFLDPVEAIITERVEKQESRACNYCKMALPAKVVIPLEDPLPDKV